jgi:hypothetical protein
MVNEISLGVALRTVLHGYGRIEAARSGATVCDDSGRRLPLGGDLFEPATSMPVRTTMLRSSVKIVVIVVLTCLGAVSASAQTVGPLSWQMQPYCNVVTLTLNSTPAGFTLDGTDDQCGAVDKASAVGLATFNAAGNVTINLTMVLAPTGKAVHVSAVVSPVTGHGNWNDSVGNHGTFAFFGVAPGLPPRPFPASGIGASSVTAVEIAPNAITGANIADGSLSSVDLQDAPRAAFADGPQSVSVPLNDSSSRVLRSLTMTIPAAGRVIVNGALSVTIPSGGSIDSGWCSITQSTTTESGHLSLFGEGAAGTQLSFPLGLTRGFAVTAGSFTVNLVCRVNLGAGTFSDSSLTATYFPG